MTITFGNKGRNNKHSLVFTILLFYLMFAPPIMGIHSLYFVAVFSWLYIFKNSRLLIRLANKYNLGKVYVGLFMMFLWATVLIWFYDGTRSVMIHYLYWMGAIFPGAIVVCLHTKKHGESLEYILKLVLWAAFIQSLLSVAAFANNDIKMYFIEKLQADDTLIMTTYTHEVYYRLFGFSSGLTFDMPSTMAIISCIGLFLAINKNVRYLVFVPTIAFSAMINARTSVVVLVIGIFVMCLMNNRITREGLLRFSLILVVSVLGIIIAIAIIRQVAPLTFSWVESGIAQLIGFFQRNTDSGYFEYLTNSDRWRLPSGINLLFGYGIRVMGGSKYGIYSDVGYINDIWFGGIVYMIVLYFLVGKMVWNVFNKYSKFHDNIFLRHLALTYMLCLPVLNIKTYIVSIGAFSTLFIIIYIYSAIIKQNGAVKE